MRKTRPPPRVVLGNPQYVREHYVLSVGILAFEQPVHGELHVVARRVDLCFVQRKQLKQQGGRFAQANPHPLALARLLLDQVGHDDVAPLLQPLAQQLSRRNARGGFAMNEQTALERGHPTRGGRPEPIELRPTRP